MDNGVLISLVAIVLSVGIGILLIIMLRKQIISQETITNTAHLLESIETSDSGFISKLAEYAWIAVRAVEQLAKTGVINSDNENKKQTAMKYLQQFAKIDEMTLSPSDLETADLLVEAAVNELPRNNT